MFSAIFSTMTIIEDRREGFLLSMLVSPAPRTSLVLGKILGSATLAWIQGMIVLASLRWQVRFRCRSNIGAAGRGWFF